MAVALISVVDADGLGVDKRRTQLERELGDARIQARTSKDAIAFLIPERNIETWIRFLRGDPADEDADYAGDYTPKDAREAGAAFPAACQNKYVLLDSLRAGCDEFRRALVEPSG